MASSPIIVLLLLLYCLAAPGLGLKCLESACAAGEPSIRFPFRLRYIQEEKCGYTGFDLYCNNRSQTILTLPFSGDFLVHAVNYEEEFVVLQDQYDCLARRFLAGFSTRGSRFISKYYQDFTFFNCSSGIFSPFQHFEHVPCLSTSDYNIFIVPSDRLLPPDLQEFSCSDNWTVTIPVPLEYSLTLTESIWLRWDGTPLCKYCKEHGLSGGAKMGIILGVASACFICIVGIFCYLSSKTRGRPNGETTSPFRSTDRRTQLGSTGMDRLAIELYPKAEVGDSWQLPRPSDTTCSICLSEYRSKETVRMIPECNHYFHACCIDPWLKQNGSCPLCRNRQG